MGVQVQSFPNDAPKIDNLRAYRADYLAKEDNSISEKIEQLWKITMLTVIIRMEENAPLLMYSA